MATTLRQSIAHHHASSVTNEIIDAGLIAGLIGGVAMALLATVYAGAAGIGFWHPVKAIAATITGSPAVQGGAGAVLLGLVVHLCAAMMFGVLFAVACPREVNPVPALVFGCFAGLSILIVMNLIVVPFLDPAVRTHLMWGSDKGAVPVSVAFLMHIVYGVGLSLAPALRRRFSPA
jgi:hypothetical protein